MAELSDTSWVIRPANAADAPQMLTYMKNLANERDLFLPSSCGRVSSYTGR